MPASELLKSHSHLFQMRIPTNDWDDLRKLSYMREVSINSMLREAIGDYLAKHAMEVAQFAA